MPITTDFETFANSYHKNTGGKYLPKLPKHTHTLCDDIMGLIGTEVELIRNREKFKKCLEQIKTLTTECGCSVINNIMVVKDPNGKYSDNSNQQYYWFWDSRRVNNPFEAGQYLVYDVGLESDLHYSDLPWDDFWDLDDSILYLWGTNCDSLKYSSLFGIN